MSHLLSSWNVPPNVFLPLKFASDEYSSLVRLSEPLRTRTELVKVAIALGRLAVGDWHSWDLVQLPSSTLLKRLRIEDVTGLLVEAKADLTKLAGFSLHEKADKPEPEPHKPLRAVNYVSLANSEHDLLQQLLPSMGFEPLRRRSRQSHNPGDHAGEARGLRAVWDYDRPSGQLRPVKGQTGYATGRGKRGAFPGPHFVDG
jgi:hypothetical protein